MDGEEVPPFTAPRESDAAVLARQLGRPPRALLGICRRCRYDYPQVTVNRPLLILPGKRPEPFPTLFWLTCPLLDEAVSRLEAEGWIEHLERRLERDAVLRERMAAAHGRTARARLALLPEEWRKRLTGQHPGPYAVLAQTGVAGIRGVDGVKCLHAHYADHLAGYDNPIGEEVDRLVREQGVPVAGNERCWRLCTLDAGEGLAPQLPHAVRGADQDAVGQIHEQARLDHARKDLDGPLQLGRRRNGAEGAVDDVVSVVGHER